MKAPFVQPRFEGARFTEHTLPLDVARDLAAYEVLLVELAKHLYLHDHPERQRVPKGFTADFHLHLDRIDDGSARPLLTLVFAGLLIGGTANVYFERSRDLIAECVAAPDGQLPNEFPRELLGHFNHLGRSLRPDEKMEIPRLDGAPAVLTPERRKNLVLAADTVYERPVELTGNVVEVNWEKSTFQIRPTDGGGLIIVPMPDAFLAHARICGGRERYQVTVSGVGTYDSWDRLQKVIEVNAIDMQPDFQLANTFDELRLLQDGWYSGRGVAPDKQRLDEVAGKMIGHFPDKVPLPAIVPTPEGNLLFEWDTTGDPSVDLKLADLRAQFHAFHGESGDIEREFVLSGAEEWTAFFTFLIQHVGTSAA